MSDFGQTLPGMGLTGAALEIAISTRSRAGSQGPSSGGSEATMDSPAAEGTGGLHLDQDALQKLDAEREWAKKLKMFGIFTPDVVDRLCSAEKRTHYLVEGFLPLEAIAIVGGESAIGKSPLMCQLALCVAAGIPFLGMRTTQSRVLYFDLENSLRDGQGMRDTLVKHLKLGGVPSDFLVSTDPPTANLESLLEMVRPKLVIIDSLRAFRPNVTEKNVAAGEWLKEIRLLSRKFGCAFVFVHHLRKPSRKFPTPSLDSCRASDWLQEMEGPRALVNQTDVRVAIVEGNGKPAALKMKWSRRIYGDSPLVSLERVYDDQDPMGYRELKGKEHLSADRQAAFDKLQVSFSTGEAKDALGLSDDPTDKFLKQCQQLGLIEKVGWGRWQKASGTFW